MDVDPTPSGTSGDKVSSELEQPGRGNTPVSEAGVPTAEPNAHRRGTEDTTAGVFCATANPPTSGSNGTIVAGGESTETTVAGGASTAANVDVEKGDKGKLNSQ